MDNNQISGLENVIKAIVNSELKKHNLVPGQWHLGKVESVIDSKHLKCFVDGSSTSQLIPCNPDIPFAIGDQVWIVFMNGNELDKFALCKRAV